MLASVRKGRTQRGVDVYGEARTGGVDSLYSGMENRGVRLQR